MKGHPILDQSVNLKLFHKTLFYLKLCIYVNEFHSVQLNNDIQLRGTVLIDKLHGMFLTGQTILSGN